MDITKEYLVDDLIEAALEDASVLPPGVVMLDVKDDRVYTADESVEFDDSVFFDAACASGIGAMLFAGELREKHGVSNLMSDRNYFFVATAEELFPGMGVYDPEFQEGYFHLMSNAKHRIPKTEKRDEQIFASGMKSAYMERCRFDNPEDEELYNAQLDWIIEQGIDFEKLNKIQPGMVIGFNREGSDIWDESLILITDYHKDEINSLSYICSIDLS